MTAIRFISNMTMLRKRHYEKPIVPTIMLTGIITSAVSKYLPGPGSHIIEQHLAFPKAVYHYSTINFLLEVVRVKKDENIIDISIQARNEEEEIVISGTGDSYSS